jgi:hypothetical protein
MTCVISAVQGLSVSVQQVPVGSVRSATAVEQRVLAVNCSDHVEIVWDAYCAVYYLSYNDWRCGDPLLCFVILWTSWVTVNVAIWIFCCVLWCCGDPLLCCVALWRFQCDLQVTESCRSQQAVCVTSAVFLLLNFIFSFLPSFNFIQFLIACSAACMIGRDNSRASRRYESLQFQEVSGERRRPNFCHWLTKFPAVRQL